MNFNYEKCNILENVELKYSNNTTSLNNKDLAMYILVNKDIEISKGKLAGQVGHAVAVYFYRNEDPELIKEYMNNQQKKIILYCKQSKLEEYEQQGYITIRDNGLTELKPNTLTCVNFGIIDKNQQPKELKRLQLVK